MFGTKGPDKEFNHRPDCKIMLADSTTQIEWSELEGGHWTAVCVCGNEHYYEPRTRPTRFDPLDPKTSHMPQCEFVGVIDPAVLKVLLKIQERDGYPLVECGGCAGLWQVPFFGSESVE